MTGPASLLASTAVYLEARAARAQTGGMVPSLVAGVVRDGGLVWSTARGRSVRRGSPERGDADTQYRIGSITKTLTAVLVLQLRDQGRLDLGDPVSAHLADAPYTDRTVRMLLAHSGGVPAEPPGDWWERSPGRTWEEVRAAAEGAPPVLPAGGQHHYSNLAYAVLGQIVSKLAGQPWAQAVQDRVLVPLGMTRTTYDAEAPAADGFSVHPYAGTLTAEPAQDTGSMAPAGQLWSTVSDLAKWLAFLADPKPAVLAPDTLDEMTILQSGEPGNIYGLGLRLLSRGDAMLVGHTGSMPGFLAAAFVDRRTKIGAAVLANATAGLNVSAISGDLVTAVLDHEPHQPVEWTPNPDPGAVGELLGPWHWGNTPFVAVLRDGMLVLDNPARQEPSRFRPTGDEAYVGLDGYFTGETLRVVRRPDGSVSHLDVATFVLTRTPYDPQAPIPGGPPKG